MSIRGGDLGEGGETEWTLLRRTSRDLRGHFAKLVASIPESLLYD